MFSFWRGERVGVVRWSGGVDRSLLHYATHTYTHKKNGTQVAFPVKVARGAPVLSLIQRFAFF